MTSRRVLFFNVLLVTIGCIASQEGSCSSLIGSPVEPTGTPSPSPSSSPTATPTPSASPTPTTVLCVPLTAPSKCEKNVGPVFASTLEKAQAGVLNDDSDAVYVAHVIEALRVQKVCGATVTGAADEIRVYTTQTYSETWDIKNADGSTQRLFVQACSH